MSPLSRLFGGQSVTPVVDVIEAQRRQAGGAVVIDVREADEWASGHVPGAIHIPMGTVPARLANIPRDRDVLVICRSGNRSGQVQNYLRGQGYANVTNVSGGISAWARAGLPVER